MAPSCQTGGAFFMLTRFDDYLIHQTPETLDHVVSGDRNFYDRYYFGAHTLDGSAYLMVAMGLYPNIGVIDAFEKVIRKLQDELVRATRALDEILHKQAENRSRLTLLDQLQSEYEGFSAGSVAALKGNSQVLGSN
jgi:hypothetical protein